MKTYEQMAQDALQKISDDNNRRRARRQNTFRVSVAIGCAMLAVLVGASIPFLTGNEQPHPSNGTVKPIATSVLQVAYLSENGWDRAVMKEQIETQMRYKLSVVDTRGLTAAQREKLRQEMVAKQEEELLKLYPEIYSEYASGGVGVNSAWDNVLFMTCRVGEFQLDINEEKMVKSIRAECSSVYSEVEFCLHSVDLVGQKVVYRAKWADTEEQLLESTDTQTRHANVYLHAMAIELGGDVYEQVTTNGFYHIRWKPSSKLYDVLNENPNKRLSDFSDQMTITVTYTDGTREEHRVEMIFHDDGNINARYNGCHVY